MKVFAQAKLQSERVDPDTSLQPIETYRKNRSFSVDSPSPTRVR